MTDKILPAAEREPFDEQLSVLVTHRTRAFLLGTALADGVREGEVIRRALDKAIAVIREEIGADMYARLVTRGSRELKRRARTVEPPAPREA